MDSAWMKWTGLAAVVVGLLIAGVVVWWFIQGGSTGQAGASGDPAKQLAELQTRASDLISQERSLVDIRAEVEAFVTAHDKSSGGHRLLSLILLKVSEFEPSYHHAQRSLDLESDQPELLVQAGTLALDLNQPTMAQLYYEAAVRLKPTVMRYRLHLAHAYSVLDERDEAEKQLREALRLDADSHEAHAAMADLLAKRGEFAAAMASIARGIERIEVAITLAEKKEEAERLSRRRVVYLRRQARILREAGRPEQALLALMRLDAQQRMKTALLEEMARCYDDRGEPGRGAGLFEQALILTPTNWEYAAGACRWQIKAGDRVKAAAHLETIRQLNPLAPVIEDYAKQINAM